AEATNEKGLVRTSSPSLTPAARTARCRPAVPLDTALAKPAPTRAANACSNCSVRGPSDGRPERRTAIAARSSAWPRTGRASGICSCWPVADRDRELVDLAALDTERVDLAALTTTSPAPCRAPARAPLERSRVRAACRT